MQWEQDFDFESDMCLLIENIFNFFIMKHCIKDILFKIPDNIW